jgi:hypothetical protein
VRFVSGAMCSPLSRSSEFPVAAYAAHVSNRQHASAYDTACVSIREGRDVLAAQPLQRVPCIAAYAAHVSIRQHTSAYVTTYVSIRVLLADAHELLLQRRCHKVCV